VNTDQRLKQCPQRRQTRQQLAFTAALAGSLALALSFDLAFADDTPAAPGALSSPGQPSVPAPVQQTLKIVSRDFESRRANDSTMTWVVQRTSYEDGLTVLTLAGVQFEEALGLTVAIVDDVVPQSRLVKRQTAAASEPVSGDKSAPIAQSAAPVVIDISKTSSDMPALSNLEPHKVMLTVRNQLIPLDELSQQPSLRHSLPFCTSGARRAVVFLRPAQLQRQLQLTHQQAAEWSRYGLAACVQWTGFPDNVTSSNLSGR